jgi:hypothetical protein
MKDAIVKRNGSDRSEIEAKRGISRDEDGKIVFTAAQKKARIAHFEAKIADMKVRTKNALAEIKKLKA